MCLKKIIMREIELYMRSEIAFKTYAPPKIQISPTMNLDGNVKVEKALIITNWIKYNSNVIDEMALMVTNSFKHGSQKISMQEIPQTKTTEDKHWKMMKLQHYIQQNTKI